MLEQFTYTNSFNETLEFGKNGLFVNENDLRDFAWSITSKNNKISGFKKGVVSKTIPVILNCNSEDEGVALRNRLFEVFEKDVLTKKHGKIQIGDYYLHCFITGSKKSSYLMHKHCMVVSLTVQTDKPSWIKETPIGYIVHQPNDSTNQPTDSVKPPTIGLEFKLYDGRTDGEWAEYVGTYMCTGIGTATDSDIVIPDKVDGIPVTIIDGGGYFGEGGFKDCTQITSVTLPNTITHIYNGAFMNCTNLTKVVIPDSVEYIGQFAFYGCTSLTSIFIPISVTKTESSIFEECKNLTVYCEAKSMPSGWFPSYDEPLGAYYDAELDARIPIPIVWGSTRTDVSSDELGLLDYPYDYSYDFTNTVGTLEIINPHYVPSNFVLRIDGAVSNPVIFINGHKYAVNVNIKQNEYLTIDSLQKTITLTEATGGVQNCFKYRDRDSNVFEKIPNGAVNISPQNALQFVLTLIEERSEPKWT